MKYINIRGIKIIVYGIKEKNKYIYLFYTALSQVRKNQFMRRARSTQHPVL